MFEVTETATEKIREYFKARDGITPMRIFVAGMGCSGPQLGISLDEATPEDQVFEESGFTFLIEKKLLEDAKPVKVDYIVTPQGEGFMITSSLMNTSGCSGCCSSCS